MLPIVAVDRSTQALFATNPATFGNLGDLSTRRAQLMAEKVIVESIVELQWKNLMDLLRIYGIGVSSDSSGFDKIDAIQVILVQ